MENKRIGEIYRERLKSVETTPPADVWENISAALDEKEQKGRILPLWYKLVGIAAVVALIIGLFYKNSSQSIPSNPPSFAVSAKKKTYDFDPISKEFERTMLRTSILLETLMANSENPPANSGRKHIPEEKIFTTGALAEIVSQPLVQNHDLFNVVRTALDDENVLPEKELAVTSDLKELDESVAEIDVTKDFGENKSLSRRFRVSTTAGAVYLNNLGNGALATGNAENSRGEVSMAYGMNFAYQVSEKVKIRTGLSKVELIQSTPNMSYASVVSFDKTDLNAEALTTPSGDLQQKMGFVEIPLEVEFSLINRKIGLNLIGGASTLLLDKSMVSMASPYATTKIGEVQNLNNVSFSTNIGLGLDYNISEEFEVHLEPIFKYQLNTFNTSSGINPYYFVIYSGLSYKF